MEVVRSTESLTNEEEQPSLRGLDTEFAAERNSVRDTAANCTCKGWRHRGGEATFELALTAMPPRSFD